MFGPDQLGANVHTCNSTRQRACSFFLFFFFIKAIKATFVFSLLLYRYGIFVELDLAGFHWLFKSSDDE